MNDCFMLIEQDQKKYVVRFLKKAFTEVDYTPSRKMYILTDYSTPTKVQEYPREKLEELFRIAKAKGLLNMPHRFEYQIHTCDITWCYEYELKGGDSDRMVPFDLREYIWNPEERPINYD